MFFFISPLFFIHISTQNFPISVQPSLKSTNQTDNNFNRNNTETSLKNQQFKSEKYKYNSQQPEIRENQAGLLLGDSCQLLEKCEQTARPSINLVERAGSTPVYEEKHKQKAANTSQIKHPQKQSSQESNVKRQESTKSILKTPVSKTNSAKQSQKNAETVTDLMKSANLMKMQSTLSRTNTPHYPQKTIIKSTSKVEVARQPQSQITSPRQNNSNTA